MQLFRIHTYSIHTLHRAQHETNLGSILLATIIVGYIMPESKSNDNRSIRFACSGIVLLIVGIICFAMILIGIIWIGPNPRKIGPSVGIAAAAVLWCIMIAGMKLLYFVTEQRMRQPSKPTRTRISIS